jgi:hypothetical protein
LTIAHPGASSNPRAGQAGRVGGGH